MIQQEIQGEQTEMRTAKRETPVLGFGRRKKKGVSKTPLSRYKTMSEPELLGLLNQSEKELCSKSEGYKKLTPDQIKAQGLRLCG